MAVIDVPHPFEPWDEERYNENLNNYISIAAARPMTIFAPIDASTHPGYTQAVYYDIPSIQTTIRGGLVIPSAYRQVLEQQGYLP